MRCTRIIDGMIYDGQESETDWVLRVRDLGNGHKEATIVRPVYWTECGPLSAEEAAEMAAHVPTEEELAEKAEANRNRAARRAKSKVRQIAKMMGCDSLLTLTYRGNQLDLDLCKAHLKAFVRRMKATIEGFCYVACFERQKRGAWHVHLAIRKLPKVLTVGGVRVTTGVTVKSYPLVLSIWRSVTGEWGGAVNEKARRFRSAHSAAKIAAYIAKYIGKTFAEGECGRKERYSASSWAKPPAAVKMTFTGEKLVDIIALVYADIGGPGTLTHAYLNDWGDAFFLASEPRPTWVKGVGAPRPV